jgi:phenylpyruvate tautomerase PptA (4-oxalocrotonate tautomerase family)
MKEEVMSFVEVFTREKLSDEIRAKLAEELSNTMMTVEIGGPTESAKMIDWMWFHTMPADSWAVGGRFESIFFPPGPWSVCLGNRHFDDKL